MMRNRDTFDAWAVKYGWSTDPFLLFTGHQLTSYTRGVREIHVWTDTRGGVEGADLCENGWKIEALRLDLDSDVTRRVLAWMQAPVVGAVEGDA